MSEELRPCPFHTCDTFGTCGCYDILYMSDKDWNTRPIEDALNKRIAELSRAVGLITTLKPTMVMDADHPLDMAKEVEAYVTARIAELEAENNRLAELLHNALSSVEIATDLGNKRWTALNKIYEDGEKHNTNWCKRIAQEGLGIKNA